MRRHNSPEIISLASPQDSGKYDIVAHVYNSHGAGLTNGTLKLEMNGQAEATLKARTLIEALPYIRSYHGQVVVVKLGGIGRPNWLPC